jgi:hypothetical protein
MSFTVSAVQDPFGTTGIAGTDAADLRIEVTVGDRSQEAAIATRIAGGSGFAQDFTATTTGYVHFDPASFAGFPNDPGAVSPVLLPTPRVIAPVDPTHVASVKPPFGFAFGDVLGAAGAAGYYRIAVGATPGAPTLGNLAEPAPITWILYAPAPATAMAVPDLPPPLAALVPGGDLRWTIEANAVPGFDYGDFRFLDVPRQRSARALAAADFAISHPPMIQFVSPPSESVSGGLTPVTIEGANFQTNLVGISTPAFSAASLAISANASSIVFMPPVPPPFVPLPLVVTLTVQNPDGEAASAVFTYRP